MPDTPRPISNAILGERIEQQGKSLTEIACNLKSLNLNFTEFMRLYGIEHEKVAGSTTAAHRRIDDLDKRMKEIEESMDGISDNVQSIATRMGWIMWVASGLGALILALIFKLITGEAQVIFP